MGRIVAGLLALSLVIAGCDRRVDEPAGAAPAESVAKIGAQVRFPTETVYGKVDEVAGVHFIVIPTGHANRGDKLATVVALHGRGDNAENYASRLTGLKARGRVVVAYGTIRTDDHGYQWFEVDHSFGRTASAFDPGGAEAMPTIAKFLTELPKSLPMKGKPIITGFSQGAVMAHVIGAQHPELVSLAAPVAGLLPPALMPATKVEGTLPRIVAFHGDADAIVNLEWDRTSIDREKAAGFSAELRVFPGVDHNYGEEERADYLNLIDDELRALDKE